LCNNVQRCETLLFLHFIALVPHNIPLRMMLHVFDISLFPYHRFQALRTYVHGGLMFNKAFAFHFNISKSTA